METTSTDRKIHSCSCTTVKNVSSSSKRYILLLFAIAIVALIYFPGSSTSKTSPFPPGVVFNASVDIRNVIATVDEKFLSVCLTWRKRDVWKLNELTEAKLTTLTRALSPAYVRVGGTPSDFVIFRSSKNPHGTLTVHIDEHDLDRINEIAEKAGWKVLFTLSVYSRLKNGSWDSSNPEKIVKYVADRGFKFGWELGNESNHLKKYNVTVAPNQLAEDFKRLQQHLHASFPGTEPILVGPGITQPRRVKTLAYLRRFLVTGHSSINAVTWHHYYVRAQDCNLAQFYKPEVLDSLHQKIKEADAIIGKIAPNLPKWMGETSSASGGGARGISDRFVAGFMWLDKLGLAAKHGYKVVFRQALFYGNYSLIGKDFEPNPDYWLSLLYKKLFGTMVLEVKRQGLGHSASGMVRVYAHCSNTKSGQHKQGAVSIMVLNLHTLKEVHVKLVEDLQGLDVDEYLFTPHGNITSRKMKLNDKLLEMGPYSSLPVLRPRRVQFGDQLILPPLTYAFYVVPDARAPACLKDDINKN